MRELAPNLWVVDRPFLHPAQDIGLRMTVIRLEDGGLFLHSPVHLHNSLRAELDALGAVKAVVAPSLQHHRFVGDYLAAYPQSFLFGAPGLEKKRKDLRFHAALGDEAPDPWRGQIEQHVFRGAPYMNEVVFFHQASRTLLLTDLCFNTPESWRRRARLFLWLTGALGKFGPHRIIRLGIRDKAAARRSVERILEWDFDRVTVTHGEVLETGGHALFQQAFDYLH